jgi:hypothetical protein
LTREQSGSQNEHETHQPVSHREAPGSNRISGYGCYRPKLYERLKHKHERQESSHEWPHSENEARNVIEAMGWSFSARLQWKRVM